MAELSDIGLIGLAVMGENLVMNMESKGFKVSVYNRTAQKVTNFFEASTLSSFIALRQRENTASPISVSGTPSSRAAMPVHLPVPF